MKKVKKDDLLHEDQSVNDFLMSIPAYDPLENIFNHFLNSKDAAAFIQKRSIPMSLSKLYKLTSLNGIPHRKIGTRLLFLRSELIEWMEEQIFNPNKHCSESNFDIIKSAQNKL